MDFFSIFLFDSFALINYFSSAKDGRRCTCKYVPLIVSSESHAFFADLDPVRCLLSVFTI